MILSVTMSKHEDQVNMQEENDMSRQNQQIAKLKQLEEEAKARAAKHVANMLQRPEQLDKIPQLIMRTARKKASIDAMLNTAMTGQLEGVRNGLGNLEKSLVAIAELENNFADIDQSLDLVPQLMDKLEGVKEENLKHTQLNTAKVNLEHIFTIPDNVARTEALLEEGNLLEAHEVLTEMECSRDDVLFELHRLGNKDLNDRETFKSYFHAVNEVSNKMEKQLGHVLMRTFAIVKREPEKLVTALRIIEREEATDEHYDHKQKQTGFLPPDRPKAWRKKCLEKLRESVFQKIEGNQLEGRDENKMWLVRHLEVIRIVMLEDLRIAKHHLVHCFPPKQNIFQYCISLYHEAATKRVLAIMDEGLEGNENVSLLQWVLTVYPGPELLGSAALGILKNLIPPLLSEEEIDRIVIAYMVFMKDNYDTWMRNTIKQEKEDWLSSSEPEMDMEMCYYTASPVLIYKMVDDNLEVANTISPELVQKTLQLSIDQVITFGTMYREAMLEYKENYFADKSLSTLFTKYMIAITNNCEKFKTLGQETRTRWWKPGHVDNDSTHSFEDLVNTFEQIKEESITFILDHSFMDIDHYFAQLFTEEWKASLEIMEELFDKLNVYFESYHKLKSSNYKMLFSSTQDRVASQYIIAMMRRRIIFSTDEERKSVVGKIKDESNLCREFFTAVAGEKIDPDFDSPFTVIDDLAGVIAADEEMLSFDLMMLNSKYSDLSEDHMVCLLMLRGMTRNEAKQTAAEVTQETGDTSDTFKTKSVMSNVQVTISLIEKLNPFFNKNS